MTSSLRVSVVHTPIDGEKPPVFQDAADSLLWALRERGMEATERCASYDLEGKNIVLGPNLLTWNGLHPPAGSLLWNMEQLVEGTPWVCYDILSPYYRYPLWNYSLAVEPRLAQRGLSAVYVPPGWCPAWESAPREERQPVDVCFFGAKVHRREHVLNQIRARDLQVYFHYICFGAERDRIVARSKIMVNIHTWDNGPVFESLRVGWALANGLLVVSESTPGPDEDRLKPAPGLFCVPYEQIAETCARLAALPRAERVRWGEENRDFIRTVPQTLPEVF